MGGNLQCIRTHEVLPSTAVTTSKMTACGTKPEWAHRAQNIRS